MDAGSFVIALLTAAGAAAGPVALTAPPDTTGSTARCIAAPDEERSGSGASARQRADTDVGLDPRQDTGTGSSALSEEFIADLADIVAGTGRDTSAGSSALAEALAQELADIAAESDDPTSQRLAAALADAGFEPSGSRQETAASRSDGSRLDDGPSQSGQRDRNRLDDQLGQGDDDRLSDDRLGNDQDEQRGDNDLDGERGGTGRQSDDRLDRSQDENLACDGQAAAQDSGTNDSGTNGSGTNDSGTTRSSDLEDVLSRGSDRDRAGSDRSSSPVERDGSGIAAALERGERTAE
jgi:resuscitation-promoting factor RpfB